MTLNTVWGGYDVQAILKHPIRLILISRSSLVMAKKCPMGVSGRGLGGVGGVSGGCLDDSRGYDVPALVNIQLDSSLLAASFSHSGLGMDKKCPYLGCLWGVCKVSV